MVKFLSYYILSVYPFRNQYQNFVHQCIISASRPCNPLIYNQFQSVQKSYKFCTEFRCVYKRHFCALLYKSYEFVRFLCKAQNIVY